MTNGQETAAPADLALATEKPNGPIAAALLAAGIGSLVLGLFVLLAEASTSFKDFVTFSDSVGALSGKTTYAVIVYVISWGGLHAALKSREVALKPFIQATCVLVGLALIFTFPPFFLLFAPAE